MKYLFLTGIAHTAAVMYAKAGAAASAPAPLPPANAGEDASAPLTPPSPLPPANDAGATGEGNAADTGDSAATAEAKTKSERVRPDLSEITTAIPMPDFNATKRNAGARAIYPFEEMTAVGMSFGVKNKTADEIASTITGANKRYRVQAKNADGSPKFGPAPELKDANGNVTLGKPEPIMEPGKVFKAADVDPKTDPVGAKCRVWRVA